MFELLALYVNDPLELIPETKYPAMDNSIYDNARPSSKCPIVKIPYILSDAKNNTLTPGIYDAFRDRQRIEYQKD